MYFLFSWPVKQIHEKETVETMVTEKSFGNIKYCDLIMLPAFIFAVWFEIADLSTERDITQPMERAIPALNAARLIFTRSSWKRDWHGRGA